MLMGADDMTTDVAVQRMGVRVVEDFVTQITLIRFVLFIIKLVTTCFGNQAPRIYKIRFLVPVVLCRTVRRYRGGSLIQLRGLRNWK